MNKAGVDGGCIIAFANRKGGVGKTSLCLHTAGALVESGFRALLVDMDEQGDLSQIFLENIYETRPTVADLLAAEPSVSVEDVIRSTAFPGLDLIPANWDLGDLDEKLAGDYDSEYYLWEALHPLRERYDYMLIDCPPYSGRASRLAMVAAHGVVIPVECDRWSLAGAQRMISSIERVGRRANPRLRLLGFVINKYNAKRTVEQNFQQAIREMYGDRVFDAVFGYYVEYKEAATSGYPITHYGSGG